MSLCPPCRSITLEKLLPDPKIFDPDCADPVECGYFHQPTYLALKESADTCSLCKLLLYALQVGDEYGGLREKELEGHQSGIVLRAGELYQMDSSEPKRVAM